MGRRRRPAGSHTVLLLGAALVSAFVVIGLVSLVWTPEDPATVNVDARLLPPGNDGYLLGTDRLGRDVLTQVMAGARNSLLVSVVSTLLALGPGVAIGLTTAGTGGWLGSLLRRATDLGVALPGILVALVLATVLGPGNTVAVIAIVAWFIPMVARVTIGPAEQILARDFVEAARSYGRSERFIRWRHVLPNVAPLVIVQASVMFASAILIEAALAYLGVGAQRPTPSWGRLLNEAQAVIDTAPTLVLFPGAAIMLAVLGFNLLGDGLRVWLDPQRARSRR